MTSHAFERMLQITCNEKSLTYGMTETDWIRVGFQLSTFARVRPPFDFNSSFRYNACENTAKKGKYGQGVPPSKG